MYRSHSRTGLTLLASAVLAFGLSACASSTALPDDGNPAADTSPSAPATSDATVEAQPPADMSVWPDTWPSDVPHPTTGEVLYSNAERDFLFKLGLVSTPEAFADLASEFVDAGHSDDAGRDSSGEREGARVHNFSNGGWRITLKGIHSDGVFEMHYLAKRV